jgi:hypothetical protein
MPKSTERDNPSKPEKRTPETKLEFLKRLGCYYFWQIATDLEKIAGLITALATVLLAIITGMLAYVANKSDQTLKATLSANRLSQRAWLALDIKFIKNEPFKYSMESGAKIKLSATLRNMGNEPALIVWTDIRLIPDLIGKTQDFRYVKKECEKMRDIPVRLDSSYGILFSKDAQEFPYTAGMNGEGLKKSLIGTKSFVPLIVGCVTYTFSNGEGGNHQTGFVYYLKRKDDRAFYVDEATTSTELLKFEPWIVGGFYAN